MRGFLLFVLMLLIVCHVNGQGFSAKDFLAASSLSSKKFESYLNKKNFLPCGRRQQNDTVINIYNYKTKKGKEDSLQVKRIIESFQTKTDLSFTYITSLKDEYLESLDELKLAGFYCGNSGDTASLLFQRRDISVVANIINEPDDTTYSLLFSKKELPPPEKVQYANDLLQFYSHENLVSVFGGSNVIKDVYYFSENEISKCSVLFPKTNRQAVFIWKDEINLCKPSCVIVGGNTNNISLANYDGVILENLWSLKEGVYSGMSLRSLLKINGNDFKFYGKNSSLPYMIVPENTGNLDFKSNMIILGCLNPNSSQLLDNKMVNANDVSSDDLGLFVFLMMLVPPSSVTKE